MCKLIFFNPVSLRVSSNVNICIFHFGVAVFVLNRALRTEQNRNGKIWSLSQYLSGILNYFPNCSQRDGICRAHRLLHLFTHFKINTKSIGIYRELRGCGPLKIKIWCVMKWARLTRDFYKWCALYIFHLSDCTVWKLWPTKPLYDHFNNVKQQNHFCHWVSTRKVCPPCLKMKLLVNLIDIWIKRLLVALELMSYFRVALLCWNNAIWLVKSSHVTLNGQSEYFFSA